MILHKIHVEGENPSLLNFKRLESGQYRNYKEYFNLTYKDNLKFYDKRFPLKYSSRLYTQSNKEPNSRKINMENAFKILKLVVIF